MSEKQRTPAQLLNELKRSGQGSEGQVFYSDDSVDEWRVGVPVTKTTKGKETTWSLHVQRGVRSYDDSVYLTVFILRQGKDKWAYDRKRKFYLHDGALSGSNGPELLSAFGAYFEKPEDIDASIAAALDKDALRKLALESDPLTATAAIAEEARIERAQATVDDEDEPYGLVWTLIGEMRNFAQNFDRTHREVFGEAANKVYDVLIRRAQGSTSYAKEVVDRLDETEKYVKPGPETLEGQLMAALRAATVEQSQQENVKIAARERAAASLILGLAEVRLLSSYVAQLGTKELTADDFVAKLEDVLRKAKDVAFRTQQPDDKVRR